MFTKNHMLDDIACMAGGAANIANGLRQQVKEDIKVRFEEMAARMDLVPREDLEHVEMQLKKMREQQEDLLKRIAILEDKKTAKK